MSRPSETETCVYVLFLHCTVSTRIYIRTHDFGVQADLVVV